MFFQNGAAMKRFTFKGVLDNFRQSVSQPTKSEQPELIETLKTEHCQLARVSSPFHVVRVFIFGYPHTFPFPFIYFFIYLFIAFYFFWLNFPLSLCYHIRTLYARWFSIGVCRLLNSNLVCYPCCQRALFVCQFPSHAAWSVPFAIQLSAMTISKKENVA